MWSRALPWDANPRGLALSPDGRRLFVANRLDDTISVIDTRTNRVASTIQLAGPKNVSALRRGEQTFYTARYSFQGQIGCSSCHIDSTFDGTHLEPGAGRLWTQHRGQQDARGREGHRALQMERQNPNLPTECGPRTEKYFWRSEKYDDLTLADLVVYIRSLPPRPNRWRLPGDELTPAQERGKAIFERSVDKFGKPIPRDNRCSYCHSGPKGTNQKLSMSDTRKPNDNPGLFKIAAADQHRADRALSARRLGANAGRNLDDLQPRRQARPHQRPDQRRTERSDRIPEDAMKKRDWLSAFAIAVASLHARSASTGR